MGYKELLKNFFEEVFSEDEFVRLLTEELEKHGFQPGNTILAANICRDEISQPLIFKLRALWGEVFNLSGLGALFVAGKTALKAAMHHSPVVNGKERYVFLSLPHIAIDSLGRLGLCKRAGREEDSTACGALVSFLTELQERKIALSFDPLDLEQNYLRLRILRELPYGHVVDLLELTKKVREISLRDLEEALGACVDPRRSDYAVISGIQIHGPERNYVWVAEGYVVTEGSKKKLTFTFLEKP